jgi:hypothetical protein
MFQMNRLFRHSHLTPYEADYAQWCAEQGALLREGRLTDLDRENLAEEIESLGRSDKREIESRLKVLLVHLLKLQFQSKQMKEGWKSTVVEQRRRIRKLVKESPSLRSYPMQVLAEEYEYARSDAAGETGLPARVFPENCPYDIDEILDLDFYPQAVGSADGRSDLA